MSGAFEPSYGCDYLLSLKQAIEEEIEFVKSNPPVDPEELGQLESLLQSVIEEYEYCINS